MFIFESQINFINSHSMKKLIFCCLIVLLGSCKDKKNEVDPETDFAAGFVGNYGTSTAFETYNTTEDWAVERVDNSLLNIKYTVLTKIMKPFEINRVEVYSLKNVTVTDAETFVVNENADMDRDGTAVRVKVEGTGKKITDGAGTRIGITMKLTEGDKVTTREYLDFKKK